MVFRYKNPQVFIQVYFSLVGIAFISSNCIDQSLMLGSSIINQICSITVEGIHKTEYM